MSQVRTLRRGLCPVFNEKCSIAFLRVHDCFPSKSRLHKLLILSFVIISVFACVLLQSYARQRRRA
jgi:hypothetical protein